RRTGEMASCRGEAMHRRSDFSFDKRCAKRLVPAGELRGEHLQTVERVQVAKKLRCKTLLVDNRFGNAFEGRVLRETCPCTTARTLQVDRGDLAVGREWTGIVMFHECSHFATPKRGFRLSRPVLNSVVTMTFTALSVLSVARNCALHSTTQPLPFGLISSVPV